MPLQRVRDAITMRPIESLRRATIPEIHASPTRFRFHPAKVPCARRCQPIPLARQPCQDVPIICGSPCLIRQDAQLQPFAHMPGSLSTFPVLIRTGAFFIAFGSIAVFASPAEALKRDFANPPDSTRPWVWGHWLHGNVDKQCITRELLAMKRAGLGGVTMFDVE